MIKAMNQAIIQGIGYLAVLCVIISFQKNSRIKILLIMLTGVILFVFHYALLGAWVGALMNLIEATVVFVAYKKETVRWAQKSFWPYVFIGVFILAGVLTAKSLTDVLPAIAQIFGTIAVWQTNPRIIRYIMLAPRPMWFIYNLSVASFAGMTAEVLILFSLLIGIVRFDILGRIGKNGRG